MQGRSVRETSTQTPVNGRGALRGPLSIVKTMLDSGAYKCLVPIKFTESLLLGMYGLMSSFTTPAQKTKHSFLRLFVNNRYVQWTALRYAHTLACMHTIVG